jgi:hypothetical protein
MGFEVRERHLASPVVLAVALLAQVIHTILRLTYYMFAGDLFPGQGGLP